MSANQANSAFNPFGVVVSSKLQLDVRHRISDWRHLVNAYEVEAGMVLLCDPYNGAPWV